MNFMSMTYFFRCIKRYYFRELVKCTSLNSALIILDQVADISKNIQSMLFDILVSWVLLPMHGKKLHNFMRVTTDYSPEIVIKIMIESHRPRKYFLNIDRTIL